MMPIEEGAQRVYKEGQLCVLCGQIQFYVEF